MFIASATSNFFAPSGARCVTAHLAPLERKLLKVLGSKHRAPLEHFDGLRAGFAREGEQVEIVRWVELQCVAAVLFPVRCDLIEYHVLAGPHRLRDGEIAMDKHD